MVGLERLLTDPVLRDQLGGKAQARSGEFSWRQSADAMREVLESMLAGKRVSGVVPASRLRRRRMRPEALPDR